MKSPQRNEKTVNVGMRLWLYEMIAQIALERDEPMAAVIRQAVVEKYPDLCQEHQEKAKAKERETRIEAKTPKLTERQIALKKKAESNAPLTPEETDEYMNIDDFFDPDGDL